MNTHVNDHAHLCDRIEILEKKLQNALQIINELQHKYDDKINNINAQLDSFGTKLDSFIDDFEVRIGIIEGELSRIV